jgi:hypothetical protein
MKVLWLSIRQKNAPYIPPRDKTENKNKNKKKTHKVS